MNIGFYIKLSSYLISNEKAKTTNNGSFLKHIFYQVFNTAVRVLNITFKKMYQVISVTSTVVHNVSQ